MMAQGMVHLTGCLKLCFYHKNQSLKLQPECPMAQHARPLARLEA